MTTAKVYVSYKADVLNPQGVTVKKALETLGFGGIDDVSVGKYFVIRFSGDDRKKIEQDVEKMSYDLLSNPVIEDYTYEIEENGK